MEIFVVTDENIPNKRYRNAYMFYDKDLLETEFNTQALEYLFSNARISDCRTPLYTSR